MLVQGAVGDAFGAGFEYVREDAFRAQARSMKYMQHPRHLGLKPGMYTDDIQMSLALAEHMVENRPWTREAVAESFVSTFHRDPRDGYARGFQKFLESVHSGEEFLERIKPHSDKSGAAMRAAPLGWIDDVDLLKERCELQARLTHDTPDGVAAALAVSLTAHFFIYHYDEPMGDAFVFLEKHIPGYDFRGEVRGPVGPKGLQIVQAALFHVHDNEFVEPLLLSIMEEGGDTDTVACIAMSLAAHCLDYDPTIPEELYFGLENGPYGRDYLQKIDAVLVGRLQ